MAENSNTTLAEEQSAQNSGIPAAQDGASAETERALQATEVTAPGAQTVAPTPQTPGQGAIQTPPVQQVIQGQGSQGQNPQPGRHRGPTDLMPEPIENGDAPKREVEGGTSYEVTYILVANNPKAVDETQNRVKALIEGAGGAIDNVRTSETRRLAYPIEKKHDGVYVVMNARFANTLNQELDRFFKLEESVLRHVILRENQ